MLEVHAPHQADHTWKGILIHIATIVVGLLIAVALEQAIEAIHHQRQRARLEEAMKAVLEGDARLDADDFKRFERLRAYLTELRSAIVARLNGQSSAPAPAVDDPRMAILFFFPSLAPYEAAKENGTIALLPTGQLRLYNRIAYARDLTAGDRDQWYAGLSALAAFRERFVDSGGALGIGAVVKSPDVATLSAADLAEYGRLVATSIKDTDRVVTRLKIFDMECAAVLGGAHDEFDLIEKIRKSTGE